MKSTNKTGLGYFRILSVISIAQLFLPLLYNNNIIHFSNFIILMLIWLVSLIISFPKVLFNKTMYFIYFYILIYSIFMLFGRTEEMKTWKFITVHLWLFIAVIIYGYFIHVKDYKGLGWVTAFSLVIIIITVITSVRGLMIYPLAARQLSGGLMETGDTQLIEEYHARGIASYDFYISISFLLPVLVAELKMSAKKKKQSFIFLVTIILILYSLIKAQFGAAVLQGIIGTFLAFIGSSNFKKSLFFLFFITVLMVAFPGFFGTVFEKLSQTFQGDVLQSRMEDVSKVFSQGITQSNTHISDRFNRVPYLLHEFFTNPLIGTGKTTEHVFWLDILAKFGLAGIIPWVLIIQNQISKNLKLLPESYRYYYLLSIALFITLGLMKNMGGPQINASIFLIVPGIYYLKYLKQPASSGPGELPVMNNTHPGIL